MQRTFFLVGISQLLGGLALGLIFGEELRPPPPKASSSQAKCTNSFARPEARAKPKQFRVGDDSPALRNYTLLRGTRGLHFLRLPNKEQVLGSPN